LGKAVGVDGFGSGGVWKLDGIVCLSVRKDMARAGAG
jgi:hypothetical protein